MYILKEDIITAGGSSDVASFSEALDKSVPSRFAQDFERFFYPIEFEKIDDCIFKLNEYLKNDSKIVFNENDFYFYHLENNLIFKSSFFVTELTN